MIQSVLVATTAAQGYAVVVHLGEEDIDIYRNLTAVHQCAKSVAYLADMALSVGSGRYDIVDTAGLPEKVESGLVSAFGCVYMEGPVELDPINVDGARVQVEINCIGQLRWVLYHPTLPEFVFVSYHIASQAFTGTYTTADIENGVDYPIWDGKAPHTRMNGGSYG